VLGCFHLVPFADDSTPTFEAKRRKGRKNTAKLKSTPSFHSAFGVRLSRMLSSPSLKPFQFSPDISGFCI